MKPEHFKPFNVEHAKAGAPYACLNGSEATVLKWDCQGAVPLAGIINANGCDYPVLWESDGQKYTDVAVDLVMLPLGYIDGKPVFAGDEILDYDQPGKAEPQNRDFTGCRWPEAAKQYPVSRLPDPELCSVFYNGGGVGDPFAELLGWRRVANAALRHAIDNGYAATKEAYDQCSRDLGKAERLLEALGYRSAGNGEWEARDCAARDMAIAEAVLQEAFAAMREGSYEFWPMRLNKLNLPSIIAKIPA